MKKYYSVEEQLKRWRLILGAAADPAHEISLGGAEIQGVDETLEALYDSDRKGGLGSSSPNINRWLGDIRRYFPSPVVQLLQKDALDRLGLEQLLLEPELLETLEADVELVATLLSLHKVLPDKTRETARQVVRKVVEELQKKWKMPMAAALRGSLDRASRNRRPRHSEIDWRRTIQANLKHYQPEYKTIIPERLHGYGRRAQQLRHLIILADQSGSMASSVVYAGILGSVMASVRSLKTNLLVFDTQVADLSSLLHDPVELLFGAQLGGGTDINNALSHTKKLIQRPEDSILVLITDLFEGGNVQSMLARAAAIKASGAQFIVLLALNDKGTPAYNRDLAAELARMDIPAFGCTPDLFPDLMTVAIEKRDIHQWLGKNGITV